MPYMIASNVTNPYRGIHWIHPLKQKAIGETIAFIREHYPEVKYVAVFGSTVDNRCLPGSDIDLCVWGAPSGHIKVPHNDNYDIVYAEDLVGDCQLKRDIIEEGIVVYAKDLDE